MKKIVYILFSFIIAQNPISDAGPDQIVQPGEEVQLDGSNSYDTDGGSISSYSWTSSDGGILTDPSAPTPTFTATNNLGTLTFNLTVTDDDGNESEVYPSNDIFISEYSEGSSPHQYLELYNGTSESIELDDYEIWLVKGGSSMSWDEPDRVLVFNKDSSSDVDLDPEFDDTERADPSDLDPGETLMILRQGEGEDFDFIGLNFVVFGGFSQLGGDDAVALKKCSEGQCENIDQVGEDTDPGSAWEVSGVSNATKNHTLVRKGTVVNGSTDWSSSAESEWDVYDQDTFDDVFNHNCTSCDDEVVVYISSPPTANATYITEELLLDSSGDICDTLITLDASSSTTLTGDISYLWIDNNNLIDEDDLTKRQPSFSTEGILSGPYEFSLIVFDGLLYSTESTVDVTIGDNLCPYALPNVVILSDGSTFPDDIAIPEGEGTLVVLDGVVEENCLSDFGFSDPDGELLTSEFADTTFIEGGVCADGIEVCLSLDFDEEEEEGNLDYISAKAITGFQFSHNGCVEDAGGGDAESNGLVVSVSSDETIVTAEVIVGDWWENKFSSLVSFDSEIFSDIGNGDWDEGETFYDVGDFIYTCHDDGWNDSTICVDGEDFIDVNQDSMWSENEPFVDVGDGEYTEGELFDDIGNGVFDGEETFIDMNGNGLWDDSQVVYLSGLDSMDPDGGNLTYTWDEISGLLDEDGIINIEDDGSVVSFTRPDFGDSYGQLQFALTTSDGSESSQPYILTVKFGRPSAPDIPLLSARSETRIVILSWDSSAEESEDSLTGYFDFEGYKLYKSTDGGETWGSDINKMYDDTGAFVGYKPYRQWDLTEDQDEFHCIYSSGYCSADNRNIDVSGYDPLSYWINIGENSGIEYAFIDSVTDGIEYTYALTSYDTGIWTTYNDPASGEILWYDSNPNEFIDVDENGFSTMESKIDTDTGRNFVTLIPGFSASNIELPEIEDPNEIFTADPSNYGNALIEYQLVNVGDLEPVQMIFEVQAEEEDYNNFEGLSTKNPRLYVYKLSADGSLAEFEEKSYAGLLNVEIDSLLDLPGAYIDTTDIYENMIIIPVYEIEDMEIMYYDDLGREQNWTEFLSGTRMMFTNPWREYGHSITILNYSYYPEYYFEYEGTGSDYYAPIISETYLPDNDNEELSRRINYDLKFNYDNTQTTFNNRPPYRYQIEFSKTAEHEVLQVLQETSADTDYSCQGSERNSMLPFRVKNLTTGEYVGLRHIDQGFNFGGDPDQPLFAPAGGCEAEGFDSYVGDCDCVWTIYEDVVFVEDIVETKYNTDPHPETTYSLELSYDYYVFSTFFNADPWNENFAYDGGQYVIYGQTKWLATTDINPGVVPGAPYDPDNDGYDNGNPWQAIYPWSGFEADSISLIIEPWTWFADGDKWTVDLSQLGGEIPVTQAMLEDVSVSPNPYVVHSDYNENPGGHKLRFTKLPTQCEINIYTISGERVQTIQYQESGVDGSHTWDLKNNNGDTVAPGLYIYTIEDINYKYKHIGKFAIVR